MIKINQQEKIYQIALSKIKGIGSILFKQLLEQFGSAKNVFASTREISKISSIKKSIVNSLINKDTLSVAECLLEKHVKKSMSVICYGEGAYPSRLREIPNPPPVLYCHSSIKDFNLPKVVSIVGTRNPTEYGKKIVEQLIEGLCSYNVIVVSGLAYGIDIYAHKAAIKHKLHTIGVVAGGVDIIYPSYHTKIAMDIIQKGSIVSEQIMGTQPDKHHFPSRNRIIAGMSDLSIVVEASKQSGALITAKLANQYNREVFAAPGCIGKVESEGCNDLIKTHQAHLLTSVDDIVSIMNWKKCKVISIRSNNFNGLQLTNEETVIMKFLAELYKSVDLNFLSEKTKIDKVELSSIALGLELKNLIEIDSGNRYRLKVA